MRVHIPLQKCEDRSYDIYIGELPDIKIDGKAVVVTNPKVGGLHLKSLLSKIGAKELYVVTLPDGEDYKNQESLNYLLDRLFDHQIDRKSTLMAFGGGVIGDMTGFAAAIYQRGIDFIQVPTTLLSQVDASVGGKTGINNRFGKNLIGAFHQPIAVYIDPSFLKTLPKREFAAGVAEMIKMAVVFDKDFFEWLEKADLNDPDQLQMAIKRSVELKAAIVAKDEKEGGVRASLNYGHTFAHVIENETLYKRYLHGEAVAIGMVMANELAKKLGLMSEDEALRIKKALERFGLPTCYEIEDAKSFYEHFFLDKKSFNQKITFVLPKGIGDFLITDEVKKEDILDVLKRFKECKK